MLLLCQLCAASASSAASLFPPSHDEYDQKIFDPRSIYGAPYGGYARATRSRLAALPLRLVGGAGFDLPPLVAPDEGTAEDEDAGAGEQDEGDGGSAGEGRVSDGEIAPKTPHFQLSDGQGRRFVCRPYHEDELEIESVMSSMFDAPILREYPLALDDDDEEDDEEFHATARGGGRGSAAVEYVHQDNRIPASHLGHTRLGGAGDAQQQAEQQVSQQQQKQQQRVPPIQKHKGPAVPIHASDIAKQMAKLEGTCAQMHLGWWSYEWCHDAAVSQFHVKVLDAAEQQEAAGGGRGGDRSSLPAARKFEIESVTNLGRFRGRKVRVDDGRGGMPHFAAGENGENGGGRGRGLSGSIVVTDTFSDGDWCEEAGVHRLTEVEMRCCKEEELKVLRQVSAEAKGGEKDDGPQAMFLSVFEPKGLTCQYKAKICSPLLCPEAFKQYEGDEKSGPAIGVIGGEDGSAGEESDMKIGTNAAMDELKPTANEAQGPMSNQQVAMEDNPAKKGKKESIRDILERTLGNHCLQRNAGWWTYELCHTRHVREFHGANKIDMVTGVSRQVVEEENMMGHYDADVLESYPDEEEVNFVINATDSDLGPKKKKAGKPAGSPSPNAGGNGAVFVQEYVHGDVCEDPDVTDSVVKAGGIVDGGIQRATTVRFSCGKNYELVKINEDSTCHYMFDVTVPALCKHPLFKAPVAKTQVVKCLPIDNI